MRASAGLGHEIEAEDLIVLSGLRKLATYLLIVNPFDDSVFLDSRAVPIVQAKFQGDLVSFAEGMPGESNKPDAGHGDIFYEHLAPLLGSGKLSINAGKIGLFSVGLSEFKGNAKSQFAGALYLDASLAAFESIHG